VGRVDVPPREKSLDVIVMELLQVAGGCNATLQALDIGSRFLYYACDRVIICWDYHSQCFASVLQAHSARINCLKALPEDGVLSGGCDCKLILWLPGQDPQVTETEAPVVHCTHKGTKVISLTNAGRLTVWKKQEAGLEEEQRFEFGSNIQESTVLFETGGFEAFACGGCDGLVHVYVKKERWEFCASLHGHTKGVRALDYHNGLLASAAHDATIRLWRVYEEPPKSFIARFGHTSLPQTHTSIKLEAVLTSHQSPVQSACFSPQSLLVSSSLDFSVMVWGEHSTSWTPDFIMGQMAGNKNAFFGAAFDPRGEHIFAHSYNGAIYHWQRVGNGWEASKAPAGHLAPVTGLSIGAGFLLTASQDQTCRLLAGDQWVELSRPLVHGYDLNCIVFGHNLLIAGGDEKAIRIFEPSIVSCDVLRQCSGVQLEGKAGAAAQSLGLSNKPAETQVAIPKWPLEDFLSTHTLWPESRKLFGHRNEISALALAQGSKTLASACKAQSEQDAEILLWDLDTMTQIGKLQGHKLTVLGLSFSPDDQYLLSVGRGREWILYKREEVGFTLHLRVAGHTRMIYACCWSADSQRFLTVSRDKRVKEWNTAGDCLRTYKAEGEATACVYLEEKKAAIGLETGEVLIMQLEQETTIVASAKHTAQVTALATVPGLLFAAGADFTVRAYALPSFR